MYKLFNEYTNISPILFDGLNKIAFPGLLLIYILLIIPPTNNRVMEGQPFSWHLQVHILHQYTVEYEFSEYQQPSCEHSEEYHPFLS